MEIMNYIHITNNTAKIVIFLDMQMFMPKKQYILSIILKCETSGEQHDVIPHLTRDPLHLFGELRVKPAMTDDLMLDCFAPLAMTVRLSGELRVKPAMTTH